MDITVVGGGLAGLTAAIAGAELGANVTLLEAHRTLGGRARSTEPPYVANDGPHVLYSDSSPYAWLDRRGLVEELAGLNCSPIAVKGTKLRMLRILSQGLRRKLITIPENASAGEPFEAA